MLLIDGVTEKWSDGENFGGNSSNDYKLCSQKEKSLCVNNSLRTLREKEKRNINKKCKQKSGRYKLQRCESSNKSGRYTGSNETMILNWVSAFELCGKVKSERQE